VTNWFTIDDLFETLDDYFWWLAKIKQDIPYWYEFYSRVGGVLVPRRADIDWSLTRQLGENPDDWPGFAMASFPDRMKHYTDGKRSPTDEAYPENWGIKLMGFEKMHKPRGNFVVPPGWTVYRTIVFYSARSERNKKKPCEGCYMWYMGTNGRIITPIKQRITRAQVIHSRSFGDGTIFHQETGWPSMLNFVDRSIKTNDLDPPEKSRWEGRYPVDAVHVGQDGSTDDTVQNWAARIFVSTMHEAMAAEDGLQISIRKGGIAARIGIPMARTSHFFHDREFEGERRKPIYHVVPEYTYVRADGREITVREHRRGLTERRFQWHGFDVCVSEPDVHYPKFSDWTPGTVDEDQVMPPQKMVDQTAVGDFLSRTVWDSRDRGSARWQHVLAEERNRWRGVPKV